MCMHRLKRGIYMVKGHHELWLEENDIRNTINTKFNYLYKTFSCLSSNKIIDLYNIIQFSVDVNTCSPAVDHEFIDGSWASRGRWLAVTFFDQCKHLVVYILWEWLLPDWPDLEQHHTIAPYITVSWILLVKERLVLQNIYQITSVMITWWAAHRFGSSYLRCCPLYWDFSSLGFWSVVCLIHQISSHSKVTYLK